MIFKAIYNIRRTNINDSFYQKPRIFRMLQKLIKKSDALTKNELLEQKVWKQISIYGPLIYDNTVYYSAIKKNIFQ